MICDVASASAKVTIASQRQQPVDPAQSASSPGWLTMRRQILIAGIYGLNTTLWVVALSIASLPAAHGQTLAHVGSETDEPRARTIVFSACMTGTLFERSQLDLRHVTSAGRARWRKRHSGGSAFPRHFRYRDCPWRGKRQGLTCVQRAGGARSAALVGCTKCTQRSSCGPGAMVGRAAAWAADPAAFRPRHGSL